MEFKEYVDIWDKLIKDDCEWDSTLHRVLYRIDERIKDLQEIYDKKCSQECEETGEYIYKHIFNEIQLFKICFVGLTDSFYPAIVNEKEEEYNKMMDDIREKKHFDDTLHITVPHILYKRVPVTEYENMIEYFNKQVEQYIKAKYPE